MSQEPRDMWQVKDKDIFHFWKEYGTTTNLSRHEHPPKLMGWARRKSFREAAQKSEVNLEEVQRKRQLLAVPSMNQVIMNKWQE